MYENITKLHWRIQGAANRSTLHPTTRAGEFILVDQIKSFTPSFLAQIKGHLTRHRYRVAAVFVDHFSDLSYVHLQLSINGDNTLAAKKAFEAYAHHHGITIRQYQTDNNCFDKHKWVNHYTDSSQTISHCAA